MNTVYVDGRWVGVCTSHYNIHDFAFWLYRSEMIVLIVLCTRIHWNLQRTERPCTMSSRCTETLQNELTKIHTGGMRLDETAAQRHRLKKIEWAGVDLTCHSWGKKNQEKNRKCFASCRRDQLCPFCLCFSRGARRRWSFCFLAVFVGHFI